MSDKLYNPVNITMKRDGQTVASWPLTAATDDWIRAGRLRKAAKSGDAQAAAALTQMENALLYTEVPND